MSTSWSQYAAISCDRTNSLLQLHISTGDNYVLDSQSSTQDNAKTTKLKEKSTATRELASQNSSANKSIANTPITPSTAPRTTSSTSKGQYSRVLDGLKELKELQQQSVSSMKFSLRLNRLVRGKEMK